MINGDIINLFPSMPKIQLQTRWGSFNVRGSIVLVGHGQAFAD